MRSSWRQLALIQELNHSAFEVPFLVLVWTTSGEALHYALVATVLHVSLHLVRGSWHQLAPIQELNHSAFEVPIEKLYTCALVAMVLHGNLLKGDSVQSLSSLRSLSSHRYNSLRISILNFDFWLISPYTHNWKILWFMDSCSIFLFSWYDSNRTQQWYQSKVYGIELTENENLELKIAINGISIIWNHDEEPYIHFYRH